LPIHITEFDINSGADAEQLTKYETVFPIFWQHPAVEGVTLWGYRQGEIWRADAYLLRANGSSRPAFNWLKEYVGGETASASCTTVGVGENKSDGFGIYPNPLNGSQVNIEVPSGKFQMSVTDIFGRNVMAPSQISQGAHVIDGFEDEGVYFVTLTDGALSMTRKLIVLK
jgi:endo-1,4-beta-xylanase